MTQQHAISDHKYCQYPITWTKGGNMLLCTNKKGAHPQTKLTLKRLTHKPQPTTKIYITVDKKGQQPNHIKYFYL